MFKKIDDLGNISQVNKSSLKSVRNRLLKASDMMQDIIDDMRVPLQTQKKFLKNVKMLVFLFVSIPTYSSEKIGSNELQSQSRRRPFRSTIHKQRSPIRCKRKR